jgi:hypothetical protein
MLLDNDNRSGLWVDLEKYRAGLGRDSIRYFGKTSGCLFLEAPGDLGKEFEKEKVAAREEFKGITLANFFPPSSCDIERDIYRLPFPALDALERAFATKSDKELRSKPEYAEGLALYGRSRLARLDFDKALPLELQSFKNYAIYRYGGTCNVDLGYRGTLDAAIWHPAAHPTLRELRADIDERLQNAKPADQDLLLQLKAFYDASPIMKYAGQDLMALQRARPIPTPVENHPAPPREVERAQVISPSV